VSPGPSARRERLRQKGGGSLRSHVASGVLINAFFSIGMQGVNFLRGFIVAIFLAPHDYGVWAILSVAYLAIGQFASLGIPDKYIQQDDPDEEGAFQKAFTLQAALSGGMGLVLAAMTPVIALAYHAPEVLAPGLVSLLTIPGSMLQSPLWVLRREMEFKRLRTLAMADPIVGAIVTIVAAMAGLGFWSFALGNVIGAWAGALVIVPRAPYPLRLRFDRRTAREYVSFSGPLLLNSISNLLLIQGTMLVARANIGVRGIGAMSLTNSIRLYTQFADGVLSSTMYPAVAAVKDKVELMHESFVKSNRLALMWGAPFGIAVALFAHDLIIVVLDRSWLFAEPLFIAVGLTSAIGHIAFNWDDYVRATGNTRPIATYSWISLVAWGIGPVPLMIAGGIRGYGIGIVLNAFVLLFLRGQRMRRLFKGFSIARHMLRALAPNVPAVAIVLALRALDAGPPTAVHAVCELVIYLDVTALVTWWAERELLGEAIGLLRSRRRR
jgi:O-antigen/teichoic acid export membrane protein